MQHYDVAIVGAGPAGSAAAITLARYGYAVALLDKERFPRHKLCGDFINPSNWPTLRQLGAQDEILQATPERVTRFRLTSHCGVAVEAPMPLRRGERAFGVPLSRASLDMILLARAKRAGAIAFEQHKIKSLQRAGAGWAIAAESPEGDRQLRAKILVGADGRNSWIAHNQQLVHGGERGRAVGFQFLLKSSYDIGARVEIHLFPGGYVGLLGMGERTINFCFVVERVCLERHGPLDALLQSQVQKNPNLRDLLRQSARIGVVRSTYPVYFAPRRCCVEGLLLVGDAARVSEPVTGEGIYFALRSGVIAGETVAAALMDGDWSDRALQRYVQDCRSEFRQRRSWNALIRYAMYRPRLLTPFIRHSARHPWLLDGLIHALCLPETEK